MDDTAFHYSRTLRIIMVLAIVVPIVAIGALLWYFNAADVPPAPDEQGAETAAVLQMTASADSASEGNDDLTEDQDES